MKYSRWLLSQIPLWTIIAVLLCSPVFADDPPDHSGSGERPLEEFLTENGTFQNSNGYSGTLDAEGFSLSVQEDGTPVFMNSSSNENWTLESALPGPNDDVTAILVHEGFLYVGGRFTNIAGIPFGYIARYNLSTKQWSALGSGVGSSFTGTTPIESLVVNDNFLYVGGSFRSAGNKPVNRIARYDLENDNGNESWSALGDGVNGNIYTMLISENILYVGGVFGQTGGKEASGIARYNLNEDKGNESWESFGDGVDREPFGGHIRTLTIIDDYLYVGGMFDLAGSQSVTNNLARYNLKENKDNESWSSVDLKEDIFSIYALASYGDNLYISAVYLDRPHPTLPKIIRYNVKTKAHDVLFQSEEFGRMGAFTMMGEYLYLSGQLLWDTVIYRYNVVEDNGEASWEVLSDVFDNSIWALDSSGETLYVGGEFTSVAGIPAETITYADFGDDKPKWKTIGGNGFNRQIRSLLVHDNMLYVGGSFTTGGGIVANGIARYDMQTKIWSSFGDGINLYRYGYVNSLIILDDFLYVGGYFTEVGGKQTDGIARYNLKEDNGNSSWSGLGEMTYTDLEPYDDPYDENSYYAEIIDMVTDGKYIIVGGTFKSLESGASSTHGSAENSIARFNTVTETWSGFGEGLQLKHSTAGYYEGTIRGLAVVGDYLYAGGSFTHRSENNFDSSHLARYNLKEDNGYSSWSAVINEDIRYVGDIVSKEDSLIVAGTFSNDGGGFRDIGHYNTEDETWYIFDVEINGTIYKIDLVGDILFIGGSFSSADEKNVKNIIELNLDTEEWRTLGDGVNGAVRAFAASGTDLYVGGFFTEAGGKPASYLARWSGVPAVPPKLAHFTPENNSRDVELRPKLDWQYDEFADSYSLIVSESDDFSNPAINESALDPSSHQISEDLEYSTTYYWKVRGSNENGSGPWSDPWSFTTLSGPTPDKVSLQSPDNTETDIPLQPELTWESADDAETYILKLSDEPAIEDPLITEKELSATTFKIPEDLAYNKTYYWHVRGVNTSGKGPWSDTWSFTTMSTPLPDQVTLLSPENDSKDIPLRPELSWETTDEAESYELLLSENSDLTSPLLHQTELQETAFQITEDLAYDQTYYWHVRGINTHGNGSWSETWSFTTVALPGQVTLQSPANNSTDIQLRPELSWMTTDEIESYELVFSKNPDFSDPLFHHTELLETTLQIPEDLDYDETYYWHVRGINAHGNGPWSASWSFTTIPPPMPAQVTLLSPENNQMEAQLLPGLTWEAADETDSYELILSEEPDISSPLLHISELQETTFQINEELTYSTTYYWQVRGVNMYGEGSWSEVWSFTTLAPSEMALDPNWPNPFSNATAGTTIRYRLPAEEQVRLEIYNISGRKVAILVNKVMPAGEHDVPFDAAGLAGGVYFYRLVADGKVMTRKMMLVK